MRLCIIESPFAGANDAERARNIAYARACMRDSLGRGEAPLASHLLYAASGVLDDDVPEERAKGIQAGFAWAAAAQEEWVWPAMTREPHDAQSLARQPIRVVYEDLGISRGMQAGIDHATKIGQLIEHRTLPAWLTSRAALYFAFTIAEHDVTHGPCTCGHDADAHILRTGDMGSQRLGCTVPGCCVLFSRADDPEAHARWEAAGRAYYGPALSRPSNEDEEP